MISRNIFSGCKTLQSVVIPASVGTIEFAAFEGCESLRDVYYDGGEEDWKKINKKTAGLVKGKTLTLKATVSPSNATNKSVTWKTSNKNIATVTSKGVAKGAKRGTATITVTTKDGKKAATCKVTVK